MFQAAVFAGYVFYQRDLHAFWYPQAAAFKAVVGGGSWPLWDPFEAFGTPMLADPASQVAYPPTWLLLLLPAEAYYTLYVLAHHVATGLGLFLLLRRWSASPLAAFAGAVAWSCSGPFLSTVTLHHHFAGASWMPWVLLAMEKFLAEGGRAAAGLGLAGGLQLLAGSADMAVLTGMIAVGRLGWHVGTQRVSRGQFAALASRVGLAAALAAGLSAVQWLPTLAILEDASRSTLDAASAMFWSVHPLSLLDTVFYGLLAGSPVSDPLRAMIFEGREPFLPSLYLGAASVPLAILGTVLGGTRMRLFCLLGLLFFVLGALGRHAALYPLLVNIWPLSLFRYPAKYMVPAALLWAALVAFGIDALTGSWSKRGRLAVLVLCGGLFAAGTAALGLAAWIERNPGEVVPWTALDPSGIDWYPEATMAAVSALRRFALVEFAAAGLLGWRARSSMGTRASTAMLACLAAGDLLTTGRAVNDLAPPELLRHRPPVLSAIGEGSAQARVFTWHPSLEELNRSLVRGPSGWKQEWAWTLGLQEALVAPTGARWGLFGSFDGDFTGLGSREVARMSSAVRTIEDHDHARVVSLLQMGSVEFVARLGREDMSALRPLGVWQSVFAVPLRLYAVPDPVPPAYLVGLGRGVASAEALDAVMGEGFDPRREVVLSGAGAGSATAPAAVGTVSVLRAIPDRLAWETRTPEANWLVVTGAYARGWTARVDGREVPVHRANLVFRAVRVPAGRHHVEMRYLPAAVPWAAAASAAASTVLLMVAWRGGWSGRWRRATDHRPPSHAGAPMGHESAE